MSSVKPYEGSEPYIFISYAHADSPAVMEVVGHLQEAGCRIWYDDGIEVGSEWPEYIAAHLAKASVMVAFLSNAYIRSDNCRKEMHYALTKKIRTVNVFLEETALTPGMEMQIGNLFALMKYCMSEDVFYEKLFAAPQLVPLLTGEAVENRTLFKAAPAATPAKKHKPGKKIAAWILALLLLAGCAALGIVGWSTGLAQRLLIRREQAEIVELAGNTEAVFSDPAMEAIAREYAGIADGPLTVGKLAGLKELTLTQANAAQLSDLVWFPDLRVLTLRAFDGDFLEGMPACGIETLILEDSGISSLAGVGNLPRLRELESRGCPIRLLGDLSGCIQLRRLSLQDADVSNFSQVKPLTRLAEVELSNCGLNELRPVLGLSSLTDIRLDHCDLRGRFFRRFDRESAIVSLYLEDCDLNSTKNLDDFTGLTTLTLIRSGAALNWSALQTLPALRSVTADASMEDALRSAVGSGARLEILS